MADDIRNETELAARVGKTPAAVQLKVIDHIDDCARRWLETAPLAALAFGDAELGVTATLAGDLPGFARSETPTLLQLPLATVDAPQQIREGAGFGSLFFSPGLGETLRINGRVQWLRDGVIGIAVSECYLHCAKALMRSAFWEGGAERPDDTSPLVLSPFLVMATMHRDGSVDVSPKGDPAGAMLQLHDDRIWFADRPGNRRMDGIKNLLSRPQMTGIAMYPGHHCCAVFSGEASVTNDAVMSARFAVQGRQPQLLIAVGNSECELLDSAALERARLWPAAAAAEDLDPSTIFATHVRLNKTRGLGAKVMRATVSRGLMQKGLEHDYKNNLY